MSSRVERRYNRNGKDISYHRDLLQRPFKGIDENDKFLSPYDGRLCDLTVQSSREVFESASGARWFRKRLQNASPWMIRLSNWAMSRDHGSEDDVRTDIWLATLKWIPACLGLAVLVNPSSVAYLEGRIANGHIRRVFPNQYLTFLQALATTNHFSIRTGDIHAMRETNWKTLTRIMTPPLKEHSSRLEGSRMLVKGKDWSGQTIFAF